MKLPIIRLLWLLSTAAASAATLAVLPGEAIQPKIDAAVPGDIIAIFGGTYPGDVTINKAVRLVEVDGQEVTITGNVTWNGVTNAPPFEGFTVGSSGKGITVNNTTGLVIKNVDASAGRSLLLNGGGVSLVGGHYSAITHDGGDLSAVGVVVDGDLASTENSIKLTLLQSAIAGNILSDAEKSWIGYSSSKSFKCIGSQCLIRIVGSTFDGKNEYIPFPFDNFLSGIWITGVGNDLLVANCIIKNFPYGYNDGAGTRYAVQSVGVRVGPGNNCRILNNYILMTRLHLQINRIGSGIECSSGILMNNIISASNIGVIAPLAVDARNNFFHATYGSSYSGGVVGDSTLSGSPGFVLGEEPKLQPSSPCVNAGVVDPVFNDLDGSRNDIGPSGGCLFDPDGWTTNKPVVISFDLAPQQLLRGVDTQVTISNGQAVAQP